MLLLLFLSFWNDVNMDSVGYFFEETVSVTWHPAKRVSFLTFILEVAFPISTEEGGGTVFNATITPPTYLAYSV